MFGAVSLERGKVMKPVILCYEKCTTCKKALKWIEEMGYDVEIRPIKEENTSGNLYKEMKLKDKLQDMSEEEQYRLLATDGMLVKRPLLVAENGVFPGFRQEQWEEIL